MNKTLKKVLSVVLAIVIIIALSAGSAVFISKNEAVHASAAVKNGLSAYEIAVSEGYKGSLQDWLCSLTGKSAFEIAKEAGFNGTEEEYGKLLNKLATSDPVTVKTAFFNKDGQLVITLSDDTTINAGNAVGLAGKNGANGKNGTNGKNGKDGKDGKNGVGITNANINGNGELVLSFSDGHSVNVGKVVGTTGAAGKDGLSAYQIAVISKATTAANESEWLASLKGEKGDKGDTGANGKSAYEIAKAAELTTAATEAEWIASLKGEKGDTGANGKSAYELAIDNGFITKMVTETQWLNSLKGDKGDTGARGEKGDKGNNGDDGLGIQNITLVNGTMTVTLTDLSSYTFENINGKDGISPQIRINAETNKWEISTDNGTTWVSTNVNATGAQGEKGDKGDTGAQGEKGDKGDTGAQGEKGDKGDDGITPIIQINSLTNEWEISVNNGLSFESTGVKATGTKGDTGAQGAKGDKGDKGDDGISVTGVSLNDENKLVITLSEGDPIILDHSLMGATGEKGDKGDDGNDGVSVASVTLTADFCLVFNYSDGTNSGKLGPIKGDKGDAGADGVGITTVSVDADGDLYITYSNTDTAALLGNIKGAKGDKGDKGDAGADGVDGKSAFELYQQAYPDYTGTYTEWLASLKGEKGEKGDKGDDGRGIAGVAFNDNGELVVTYTDGTETNLGVIPSSGGGGTSDDTPVELPEIGDTVKMGKYNSKDVEWIVLDKNGSKVFLISKDVISSIQFSDKGSSATWENSTLRSFMNDTFYNAAFSDSEKKMIVKTNTDGTENYLYALSMTETENAKYKPLIKGASGNWWLRTTGGPGYAMQYVSLANPYIGNQSVALTSNARPAMWVEYKWQKEEMDATDGLEYYLLPDGTYGVKAGTTQYLENIVIPAAHNGKAVTVILENAFENMSNLKSISIPDSAKTIKDHAFDGCTSLEKADIPSSVTTIGAYAFNGCSSLKILVLPKNLSVIEKYSFYGCSAITSVTIPESVTQIEMHAFNYAGLKNVTVIGNTGWKLETVDNYIYQRCSPHGGYPESRSGNPVSMQKFSNNNAWKTINLSDPTNAADYLRGKTCFIAYESVNDGCYYAYNSGNATISRVK